MSNSRRLPVSVGLDVFVVVLFVAIGRRNHEEGSAGRDVIGTAAPFLIGLAAAWVITRAWRRPTSVLTGLAIGPLPLLVGMIVRRLVFDDGSATSFVVVATVFLGVFLVGWRAVWRIIDRRHRHRRRQLSGGSLIAK